MARAAGKPGTRGSPGGSCAFPPAPGHLVSAVPTVKVFLNLADLESAEVSARSVQAQCAQLPASFCGSSHYAVKRGESAASGSGLTWPGKYRAGRDLQKHLWRAQEPVGQSLHSLGPGPSLPPTLSLACRVSHSHSHLL